MKRIGFIGAGNMAFAMMSGAMEKMTDVKLSYSDLSTERLSYVAEKIGVPSAKDNLECAKESDYIVLAIKPQYYETVLTELKIVDLSDKILISIAPGITIQWIQSIVGSVKVVRAMPNTPALVQEGMSGVAYDSSVFSDEEKMFIEEFFTSFGKMSLLNESQLDMIVPVSGSSPAYIYMFIEAMADAGVLFGLSRQTAYEMAAQTVYGSAKMVLESGQHPGILKDAVCSPGGTTIEAVKVLEREGFRSAVIEAMSACYEKTIKFK